MKLPFFQGSKNRRMSAKDRVLLSEYINPSGRSVAEKLMTDDGLMMERLFNHIGELEGRLKSLYTYVHLRDQRK